MSFLKVSYTIIYKTKLQLDPCIICGASLGENAVVKREKVRLAPFVSVSLSFNQSMNQLWIQSKKHNQERKK